MRQDSGPLTADQLYERYLDAVYRYVSRRIAPREEAEDITEEVFAAAFVGLSRFRGQCEPRLWLLGIARNKVADAIKQRARRRETLASELTEGEAMLEALASAEAIYEYPEAAVERAEQRSELRRLVENLHCDQREALLLHYADGLSIAEVGVVMGRSTAAINSLLQRARAMIFRQGQAYFLHHGEVSSHGRA